MCQRGRNPAAAGRRWLPHPVGRWRPVVGDGAAVGQGEPGAAKSIHGSPGATPSTLRPFPQERRDNPSNRTQAGALH
jgi:hypothetical protein